MDSQPQNLAEVDRLLDRMVDLAAGEREAALLRECSDPAVRAQVRRLLGMVERLEEGRDVVLPPIEVGELGEAGAGPLPNRIGPYRVRSLLGSGGMGVVYLADDLQAQRPVAVKVLRGASPSPELARRFAHEAELLGRLQHPGIAQVFRAGTEGQGPEAAAYLALEYIDGVPLTRYADEAGLEREDRVRLLRQVADAVHHAHLRGVVHRDLKPSNVLVDREGRVKVIDFGVARALEGAAGAAEATRATRTGQVMGTLAYMAPEQARGDVDAVDTRADVYALGVIGYQLLAGRRPLDLADLPLAAAAERVCSQDPPRLGVVAPDCRGDLDWIVGHAIDKDPARRYPTAGGLAADLARHLAHEPVEARPASTVYQLTRIARRHRALVTGVAATLLAVVIGSAVSIALAVQNTALAHEEEALQREAEADQREAERLRGLARAERERVLQLADAKVLEGLVAEAEELWPAHPARLEELRDWHARAEALTARAPLHAARRDEILARHAERPSDSLPTEDAWQLEQADGLLAGFDRLSTGLLAGADAPPAAPHGWSVPRRIAFAEALAGPAPDEVESAWEEAIESIADPWDCPDYDGLELEPQLGLVPLGRNPDTELWEFAHLASGAVPAWSEDGGAVVTEQTGIVLVLLPGGRAWLGDQASEPTARHYSRYADDSEWPVHEVELSPFFLSKFELTQGQWLRLAGENPSFERPGLTVEHHSGPPSDLTHPVETVSWEDCTRLFSRFGLTLPSESQWEYGARAGSGAPWHSGHNRSDVRHAANLAGAEILRTDPRSTARREPWDDGWSMHSPVGSFAPNLFGLFDVLGNVGEWCLDCHAVPGGSSGPALDPVYLDPTEQRRVVRGGSIFELAPQSTLASRFPYRGDARQISTGARPARPLAP
ncbi:MAG: SUMF1/EgtB/PvdO family nonheme iron enzyme [Planctomycetota bacterium]